MRFQERRKTALGKKLETKTNLNNRKALYTPLETSPDEPEIGVWK